MTKRRCLCGDITFQAPATAKHSFCRRCGTFQFSNAHAGNAISVAPNVIANPIAITLEKHVFMADKGDRHSNADNFPHSGN